MELNYLSRKNCALLVVDIQERLMPVIAEKEQVLKNSILLIKTARTLQMPVIATTQYVARIGKLLPGIEAELENMPHDKMEFNSFANDGIRAAVAALSKDVDTLIVCGVEAHICIYQTVLGGLMEGYKVWVSADAVSSRALLNYRIGLERIREIGGKIGTTELIIYELLGKAGTSEFKELLPFLK